MWFAGKCGTSLDGGRDGRCAEEGGPPQSLAVPGAHFTGTLDVVLHQAANRVVLLFDGRIDELAALRRALGQQAVNPEAAGTGTVLVAAYERWGKDFPAHVLGDYAFALWDARERKLLLGRDPAATRPLYFAQQGASLWFGSEPRLVLQAAAMRPVVNESSVAEWLGARLHDTEETFFRGVSTVRAGEVVLWHEGRLRTHSFWHPERLPRLQMRDPREYAEAARAITYRAVERRLPAGHTLGTFLSGGLDSSTVTDTAARLLAVQGRTLTAFTAVPEMPVEAALFPGRFTDESVFARMVAAPHGNVMHALVSNHAVGLFAAVDALSDATGRPFLNPGNAVWLLAILQEARRRGVQVLLDGTMSNFTLSYDGAGALPSLLRRGRWLQAARLGAGYHRHDARWRHVAALALLPLLPRALRLGIDRVGRGATLTPSVGTGGNPAFLQQYGVGDMVPAVQDLPDPLERRIATIRGARNEMYMMMARSAGLQNLSPTADRELMDFCLSVPEEQYVAGGDRRALMRNMMTGLLPEPVLRERRKGLQAADAFPLMRAARADFAEELTRMREVDVVRRAIDLSRIDALMAHWPTTLRSGADYLQYCIALPRAFSMGRFLRRMEQGELFSTASAGERAPAASPGN